MERKFTAQIPPDPSNSLLAAHRFHFSFFYCFCFIYRNYKKKGGREGDREPRHTFIEEYKREGKKLINLDL
jgi:hypothetical protein